MTHGFAFTLQQTDDYSVKYRHTVTLNINLNYIYSSLEKGFH